jgi:hypothetical protein
MISPTFANILLQSYSFSNSNMFSRQQGAYKETTHKVPAIYFVKKKKGGSKPLLDDGGGSRISLHLYLKISF